MLFSTVWIKEEHASVGRSWAGCLDYLSAASAAFSIPAHLSGQFHLAMAAANEGLPPCCRLPSVPSLLSLHKNSPNSKM